VTRTPFHPWYDVAWPVLAGMVAGAGLLASYRWSGPLVSMIALAVLEVTLAPIAWCVLAEFGHRGERVVLRIATGSAVTILALTGLGDVLGSWAFVIAAGVLLTSPVLRGWTHGGILRTLAERASPRIETRRRFDEIVAGLAPPDEDLPDLA
jgi:hypothetical protein